MKRSGFTLVELLISLSIIACLIALLFPAIGRVRSQCRMVTCASNLRQITFSLHAYSTDNNGVLPLYPTWWQYLGGTLGGLPGSSTVYLCYQPTVYSGTVWTCPFASAELEYIADPPNFSPDCWSNHYGLNRNLLSTKYKLATLRNDVGLIADGLPIYTLYSTGWSYTFTGQLNSTSVPGALGTNLKFAPWPIMRTGSSPGRVTNLHGGYFNMSYPDGHVAQAKTISSQDLTP